MMEGNILGTGRKNSYFYVYFTDMLKNYQRQVRLFKFSQKQRRAKDEKNDGFSYQWLYFAMASVCNGTMQFCNGYVALKNCL